MDKFSKTILITAINKGTATMEQVNTAFKTCNISSMSAIRRLEKAGIKYLISPKSPIYQMLFIKQINKAIK